MSDYDFHQLSAYDLEVLARDLLQTHWNVALESFKAGKDRGIDLRYAQGQGKIIVQVKHYMRTGLNGLMRDLKKEATKVTKLQPTRYGVVTSVPLSPDNKSAIISIFGSNILAVSDVIGCEDLNNLLGQYPQIETQHYKLWLASTAVLDRVLRNATIAQSEFKARQVHEAARRYVQNDAFPQALKMLNEHKTVIVAGPPGVGKSTLADLLLYQHLENGYQPVLIQRDIEEGKSIFKAGTKQVFYFDDFMGATFLGDMLGGSNGNNDRALLDFVAMVRASTHARLIVTTREHVYAQAMMRSERLRNSNLDDYRVFLNMPSYSFAQKAHILYNHLFFSDLPAEYRDELLKDEFYLQIIKHEKLNPRLIEWLSSFRRVRTIPVASYRKFVGELLNDPSDIWRHAYEQEISDAARSLLLTLFSYGGKVANALLERAFGVLHEERARRYMFQSRPEDYRSAIREIANSFIKPLGNDAVEVIDPSVLDLLNAVVREIPANAVDIVAGAGSFAQIERLWAFAKVKGGKSILSSLGQNADRIATAVRARMLEERRVELTKGNFGYKGPTYEIRLSIVVEMAEVFTGSAFTSLVKPMFDQLQKVWQTESPHINDGVEAIRALDSASSLPVSEVAGMRKTIVARLLEEASSGCRSDELRELLVVIDTSADAPPVLIAAARSAFEHYQSSLFSQELKDCRSVEEFDALKEDLEFMGEELNVEIKMLLTRVVDEKDKFEEHLGDYEDHMQDEWKERWRGERDTERNVAEMFGSLREDHD